MGGLDSVRSKLRPLPGDGEHKGKGNRVKSRARSRVDLIKSIGADT